MDFKYKSLNKEIKKGLYLVPTPIGNLGDISLRAIETLKSSDYILCEDTRVSKKLLEKYEIKSELISNHKFNEKKNLPKILNLLKSGSIVSIISDAGTPSISDPGSILVKECIANNFDVTPLPGPSSVSTAVSISGFSEKFLFYGFFPEKEKTIKDDLKILSELNFSIVFFISPKKINKIIPHIKKNFLDRDILICREMTKIYEEYIRCKVSDLQSFVTKIKGEITIVLSEKKISKNDSKKLSESDKAIINKMINKLSIKEISYLVNRDNKISKKDIYNYCLKIKNEN